MPIFATLYTCIILLSLVVFFLLCAFLTFHCVGKSVFALDFSELLALKESDRLK